MEFPKNGMHGFSCRQKFALQLYRDMLTASSFGKSVAKMETMSLPFIGSGRPILSTFVRSRMRRGEDDNLRKTGLA